MTSNTAVSWSVAILSSKSLPNNSEKPNQPKRLLFLKCDYSKISVKHVCSGSLALQQKPTEVVFIILYWKDGCSDGFCNLSRVKLLR